MRIKAILYFLTLSSVLFFLTVNSSFSSNELSARILLYKTIEVGDLENAKLLISDTDINYQDQLGYTLLYKAVFYDRLNFVQYFF